VNALSEKLMGLHLGYLEKYESVEGKNLEHIELLQLHKSNIKVADYFTVLLLKEALLDKLHKAIAIAKNQVSSRLIERLEVIKRNLKNE
jgi:CRISPR/Cas system CMR-associated protein Cmr3 (group 5 of RAMP superfamily)